MDSILFFVGNMPACFDCREGHKEELWAKIDKPLLTVLFGQFTEGKSSSQNPSEMWQK